MKKVLVTGANGFIGKNLCTQLSQDESIKLLRFDVDNTREQLKTYIKNADFIFHLAGINRPEKISEFDNGNRVFTEDIIAIIDECKKKVPILITSSIQAALDNPYGKSKVAAEKAIFSYRKRAGADVFVYRLPNVFGKWCKPNYNSVVATFCYNIANNMPIIVSDSSIKVRLVYIDDVVKSFINCLYKKTRQSSDGYCYVKRTYSISLGQLANKLNSFKMNRKNLVMPSLKDSLSRHLYSTLISYLPTKHFDYPLSKNSDERGWLAELIKSKEFGQMFVSKTKPGVTRGNHWHHSKIEKFFVVEGNAEIRFRKIIGPRKVIKYNISGDKLTVVDIPAGYTHSIKNIGNTDLITIFWASEIFNQKSPDTYYQEV